MNARSLPPPNDVRSGIELPLTHAVGRDVPEWSIDPRNGGICILGNNREYAGEVITMGDKTCHHFAPAGFPGTIPPRCRRERGHDGAHELIMVWSP